VQFWSQKIPARFLNVISLFNGTIPFVAIQMRALRIGEHITLVFTTVVDELTRGLVDDDEVSPPADRAWWEKKAPATIMAVDELLKIAKQFDPSIQLKYKKSFIGLSRAGQTVDLVTVYPRKTSLEVQMKLPETDDLNAKIEDSGVDTFRYNWGRYRLRLTKDDVKSKAEIIRELMYVAYDQDARPTDPDLRAEPEPEPCGRGQALEGRAGYAHGRASPRHGRAAGPRHQR
jgi:predicted transport protein